MRTVITEHGVTLWASANDTYHWATKPGAAWPCSSLRGRRFCATFDAHGNLVDLTVDGRYLGPTEGIDNNEFSACCADLLRPRLSPKHSAWFGIVGQFGRD